jgi:hypothetical protein
MHYLGPFIYGFRVKDRAVEVVLFKIVPIYRLSVDDIMLVEARSWLDFGITGFTALRMTNHFTLRGVLIQKRKGLFRHIVIAPDDPGAFVERVAESQRRTR